MNIVIVSGGSGTRFGELSIFPKILLPDANNSSLLLNIMSSKNKDDSVSIIINSKFYEMLKDYIDVNSLKDNIRISQVTNTKTSAETILKSLCEIPTKDVLFIWSDIDIINLQNIIQRCNDSKNNIVFTNSNGKYRYLASYNNGLVINRVAYDGNVPGIYFFKNTDEIRNYDFNLYVFSDDIEITKSDFGNLFNENFENVIYQIGTTAEEDFINLSSFKNKILFNSTFSFWAGYISDRLFQDNTITAVPYLFTRITRMELRAKKNWKIIG